MSKVFITQTAAITALGDSLDKTWHNLCAGESALAPVARFPVDRLDGNEAACVDQLDETDENKTIYLLKKLFPQLHSLPENTFLIWTGIKGGAEQIEREATGKHSVEHQYVSDYRRWLNNELGLNSDGMEVNGACASSTIGICVGANMIEQEEVESVLVIGADWVSRFTFSGFAALRALSKTKCRPFDQDRDGLALGEAAAAVHLVSVKEAEKSGLKIKAELKGWGIANDANHITGPARDGRGLSAAIKSAISQADLAAEDISAFCAHGTGTVYNDAMELCALENIFGDRRFPLFSIKGALGHTLGAAGALEAALSVEALKKRLAPPTCGLLNPEERALGRAINKPQQLRSGPVLTSNSGFGGLNAALILGRSE